MTIPWTKRVDGRIWDKTNIPYWIDYAKSIGAECFDLYVSKYELNLILFHGGFDFISQAISYAHSKQMYLIIRHPEFGYTASGSLSSWDEFVNTPSQQAAFLYNFEQILKRYPDLDGIEIEESEGYICYYGPNDSRNRCTQTQQSNLSQNWRTFKNQFLQNEKDLVLRYHPNFDNGTFHSGLNMGNSWLSSQGALGYDINTIISKKLVNYIAIQINQPELSQFINRVIEVDSALFNSGIEIDTHIMLHAADLSKKPECATTWSTPSCFNQEFFNVIREYQNRGYRTGLFTLERLSYYGKAMWPNDATPGATAGDKVRYIWSQGGAACPSPSFDFQIKEV